MINTAAVVVTYNRIELLKECIQALQGQSARVYKVVVVNNASTDGTTEYLSTLPTKMFEVINSEKNLGGAGGFTLGMETALQDKDVTNLWIMDDDTIPTPTALEELQQASIKLGKYGFLCSEVKGVHGEAMNMPAPSKDWNSLMDDGFVKVEIATFVSLYVSVEAIHNAGLPYSEFFIWGDDTEFTYRLAAYAACYYVTSSKVIHKSKKSKDINIVTDNDRIPRYYYYYRNSYFYYKESLGWKGEIFMTANAVKDLLKVSIKSKYKIKKITVIISGWWAGIWFNPKK